jgi:ATP-binding cassette subfamily C protein CydC
VQPLPSAFQHWESNLAAARRLFEIIDAPTPPESSPQVKTCGYDEKSPLKGPGKPKFGTPLVSFLRSSRRYEIRSAPSPSEATPPFSTKWGKGAGGIGVNNLSFRYTPDDPPALDGISFTLAPGQTLALVGTSGAGKSTLINLLLRFWEHYEGEITINGRDLRSYAPDEARSLFGVVRQSTYLFNATVRDNLLIAQPDANMDDLIHAARQAQIHEFIEALPESYDTWIGEQGLKLSGGERQRLAIARAILKNAPILLLDEAAANLDPITERDVMQAIHAASAGRATLLITHRITGLESVDEILVLRAGQIIERGTHAELIERDGAYRRQWELQRSRL